MAERGAHLSQLLFDSNRPSIFELVAQEGLNQALRGTLKFIVRVCLFFTPCRLPGWFHEDQRHDFFAWCEI